MLNETYTQRVAHCLQRCADPEFVSEITSLAEGGSIKLSGGMGQPEGGVSPKGLAPLLSALAIMMGQGPTAYCILEQAKTETK